MLGREAQGLPRIALSRGAAGLCVCLCVTQKCHSCVGVTLLHHLRPLEQETPACVWLMNSRRVLLPVQGQDAGSLWGGPLPFLCVHAWWRGGGAPWGLSYKGMNPSHGTLVTSGPPTYESGFNIHIWMGDADTQSVAAVLLGEMLALVAPGPRPAGAGWWPAFAEPSRTGMSLVPFRPSLMGGAGSTPSSPFYR